MNGDTYSLIKLLKGWSSLTVIVPMDGASTTSLGNMFQCFTIPIKKKLLAYIKPNSPLLQFEIFSFYAVTTSLL